MPKSAAEFEKQFTEKQEARYPELRKLARDIAQETCQTINARTKDVVSEMPYKAQFVLEEVIKILEASV